MTLTTMPFTAKNTNYLESKFNEPLKTRRGAFLGCETCKRTFYVHPCRLKRNVAVRFCSMACYKKNGEQNPFWGKKHKVETKIKWVGSPSRALNGRKLGASEIERWKDIVGIHKRKAFVKHHGKCQRCVFADIRVLIIHHKDRNRRNNHRSNLEVLCPNCHALEHYLANDGTYSHMAQGDVRCA